MTTSSDSSLRVATRHSNRTRASRSRSATSAGSPLKRSALRSSSTTRRWPSGSCAPGQRSGTRRFRSSCPTTRPSVTGSATSTPSSTSSSPRAISPQVTQTPCVPICAKTPSGSPARSLIYSPRTTRAEVFSPCSSSSMHGTPADSIRWVTWCAWMNKTARAGTLMPSKKHDACSPIPSSKHSARTASKPPSPRSTRWLTGPTGPASQISMVSSPDSPPHRSSRSTVQSLSDEPTDPMPGWQSSSRS